MTVFVQNVFREIGRPFWLAWLADHPAFSARGRTKARAIGNLMLWLAQHAIEGVEISTQPVAGYRAKGGVR